MISSFEVFQCANCTIKTKIKIVNEFDISRNANKKALNSTFTDLNSQTRSRFDLILTAASLSFSEFLKAEVDWIRWSLIKSKHDTYEHFSILHWALQIVEITKTK